ncbi:3-beta hydroxysteroid dehydrogenase [Diplodia corticola]|uniref:3-beta hydroxysteroid dehydrogenase n=1 Tax=Diplodia corticola TaxID=236234 RepID=A0A1J9RW91_9PEZI|nr:3-beta hydroxysteroid dehydrogenase [Diplodia corticola]OJD32108.1 3-beta hydroxysteroid dehydrogenase [Diplodia corticola]
MANQRIFITGGSGFVGSAAIELAISRGYQVHALSRSESSDAKLTKLGAVPVRGDLRAFDVLRQQSAQADIVLHYADSFFDNVAQDYAGVVRTDKAAVDAMSAGLEGSNKPFVITSGSLVVASTGAETSEDSPLWEKPLNDRILSERHALEQCSKGIKVSAVRLAPFVHGRGASGVKRVMTMFSNAGKAMYVGSGDVVTSAVHVDDAADLYLLAAEKAEAGEAFNAVAENVTMRDLAEAIGDVLQLPVNSVFYDDAAAQWGEFFARFLSTENWASGKKAADKLGWGPKGRRILDDVKTGSYVAVAGEIGHR